MAIIKVIRDHELYLYMNGNLIYKRWLDSGASKVFDIMAYDKYTYTSFTDRDLEKTPRLILIDARLNLFSSENGGRHLPLHSGLRPNHVFEYVEGKPLRTFVGDIQFEGSPIEPGEERNVLVRFSTIQPLEEYLTIGRTWWIHEGDRIIGEAKIEGIRPTE